VTEPVRIGVDARELLGETTGVGRYLGELLRRWTQRPDASTRQFVLYSPEPLRWGQTPTQEATHRGLTPGHEQRVLRGGSGTWWEQTALRKAVGRDRLDAFFAPAYTAPLGIRVPLALTIHDVSFLAHPEWFRPRERLRRRFLTSRAARTAAAVFTDSEFSRSEIERHLHIESDRLDVIPPGVTARARLKAGATDIGPRIANREPRSPLVLFVGSLFNRRRLPDLIAAFALSTRDMPNARLAIVGADRTWPKQDLRLVAAAHGVASRVDMREYVDENELTRLYSDASVFAFLSEYEGFGLTPLEALSAGVPIVVLDTPIAREVYGPAAAYVPHEIDATAATLRNFLTSPAAAAEQLAQAPAVLARYSWDRAADDTLRHIDRIARPRRTRP
jgi:glycosyltransferase involved in cell wall biosynthesis